MAKTKIKMQEVTNIGKLKPSAMALAVGMLSGLSLFIMAIIAGNFDWGGPFMNVMSSVYVGYDTSFFGALVGFIWGFIDGLICGGLLAWFYNLFCGCPRCNCVICKC